jgi:hypothetical protein
MQAANQRHCLHAHIKQTKAGSYCLLLTMWHFQLCF